MTFFNTAPIGGRRRAKSVRARPCTFVGRSTRPQVQANIWSFRHPAQRNPNHNVIRAKCSCDRFVLVRRGDRHKRSSNIVVDGGSNGVIQATANGTKLANQQDNGACVISHGGNCNNVTVQNLTCSNIYIDASVSDNGGENTYGIDIWNTSFLVIQNNTLHDMKWAIRNSYQTGSTFSNLT